MDIFLATLFIIVCVLLILVVLLQKGRGGGLSAALGGFGSSAFGTRVGDMFTWITIVLTGLFLLLAIGVSLKYKPDRGQTDAPILSEEGRAISKAIWVTIDPKQEDNIVYYTLDGSDPSDESIKYPTGELIKIEPGTTIKMIAYRSQYKPSKPVEVKFPKEGEETSKTVPDATTQPAAN